MREAALLALVALASSAFIALESSTAALANDSAFEFETGGLHFKQDPDIAMRAEDLSISMARVTVAYTFFNRSPRDKTIMVAFPMPDIVGAERDSIHVLPTGDPDNIFGLQVTADGVPVSLHLEQRAMANGVDQTARLRQLHVPLMPIAAAADDALDRLPQTQWADLVKLGIARIESPDTGGSAEDHLVANWTLQSAFTWTQTFPARREVKLDQAYKPSVGNSNYTMIGTTSWHELDGMADYVRKYCIDASMVDAVRGAMRARKIDYAPFGERRIAYVLKTGANWAGPIGNFHLTVDKGDAANLASFCGDGVTRSGPTTLEVARRDFTPDKDLFILILTPRP